MVARRPLAPPRSEGAGANRLARGAHQANEEMYIVQREQAQAENLVGDEQVAQVRPREPSACTAGACVINGSLAPAELGALDVEPAVLGEDRAVAAHARGRDAVEQVDPAGDPL